MKQLILNLTKSMLWREEEKKLKIPEKERKNTDPSLNTQFCIKGLLFSGHGFLFLGHMGILASTEKKINYEL